MYTAPFELRVAPKDEALYVETGRLAIDDLTASGLKPDHAFLDLGCGSGRVASHLTGFLTGDYLGIDIDKPRVDWCNDVIAAAHSNFRFHWLDASNRYYKKSGTALSENQLPAEDNSFDFCQMNSVFTHLDPTDSIHYLKEVARVLKPGGKLWATWFLLTDVARARMAQPGSTFNFTVGEGPDFYETEDRSLVAVAYDPEFVFTAIADAGLVVEDEDYGGWSGLARTGSTKSVNQDRLLLRKP